MADRFPYLRSTSANTENKLINTTYAVGVSSLRQSGACFLFFTPFALYERKRRKEHNRKYHAAAGWGLPYEQMRNCYR